MAVKSSAANFPLFREFPTLALRLGRVALSDGPSPVAELESISRRTGTETWIKNDGLYGTLYGGNKPRKLEFVLPRALATGARTIMTTGPLGTHHGLATALYGRSLGLNVALLLTYQRPSEHVVRQLCRMRRAGAEMLYTRSGPLTAVMVPYLAVKYTGCDRGRRPYLLPPGGSTPLGALGYVNAALELAEQVRAGELPEPKAIVLPVGSGGTAAGLALGLGIAGLRSKLVGVAITRAPTSWAMTVRRLALETARLLRQSGAGPLDAQIADVLVSDRWLGGGYGRSTTESEEALRFMTSQEAVPLEPTYTAKTMAGLLAMCTAGELRGPVLYWHTYDARMAGERAFGPADYAALPREFRRFCPARS